MIYIYLILAIIALVFAHYFKTKRQEQFIEIYEKPNKSNLIQALSFGYIINFIIPFRLGDVFRVWYIGRKMKNGLSFSLATVIIDRILDIITVAIIFLIFYFLGFTNNTITSSILFYMIAGLCIVVLAIINYKYSLFIKLAIKKFASIFNENIEFEILKFSWYMITALKDLITKINKVKIILNTIIIWTLYTLSYGLFATAMTKAGSHTSLVEVFTTLFSKNSFDVSTKTLSLNNKLMIIYLLLPLIILIVSSFLLKNKKANKDTNNKYLELLPQVNFQDKLIFLEGYFLAKSREYFNNYITLNRDVSIIKDYSAGSNATTMLCTNNNKMFFRKYSYGKDSQKLYEQVKWLENHQKDGYYTKIDNIKVGYDYCSYDMPYIKEAVSCFNYVHSMPLNKGWNVLKNTLDTIKNKLHTQKIRKAKIDIVTEYIDSKVINNIKKIENGQYIKPLLKYDYLIINGKKYHNLKYFKKYLTKDYLTNLFINDEYSEIHGDFTIENIICLNNDRKNNFYIIDPNTGNYHDSPNLDYAKLLQSLHGGYEFLMNTKNIEIENNNINYLYTKTSTYDFLYDKYHKYLNKNFSEFKVKSIYFHEIIHWLRLLPYKIEKNGKRSVLFYAGLIIILNDIIEKYGDLE